MGPPRMPTVLKQHRPYREHLLNWVRVPGREQILARKRREYRDMVPQFYDIPNSERSEEEIVSLRQVCC